jgi:hypothetical protein
MLVKRDRNKNTGTGERVDKVVSPVPVPLHHLHVTTYGDEIVKVLTILETGKVNIYDKNNTPGMYLRQPGTGSIDYSRIFKDFKVDTSRMERLTPDQLALLKAEEKADREERIQASEVEYFRELFNKAGDAQV